jgi:two-component system LytT family sensor kinase
MDKTEKRIALYCALFIAIILNSNRLLALRENGIMAHYWHFNLYEFLFQIIYAFGFCYLFIRLNLKPGLWTKRSILTYMLNGLKYFAFLIVGMLIGGVVQRRLISDMSQLKGVFWGGYLSRFMATGLLAGIVVKIILLIREGQQKSKENEQLKSAYLEAELELLRENAQLAQHYVSQLSKVFRYSLQQSGANLVTLGDEITMITSYGELLIMRLEKGFQMEINIDQSFLKANIPHLSLQLLLENAAKHNIATIKKPLKVNVFISGDYLTVRNNLQEMPTPESSTGIGLANLNERYKILMGKEIEIIKSDEYFTVKLPLAL